MKIVSRLWNLISTDRRPDHEKAREREFILAANSLKTLSVTDRGGMSIDPEEIREQIVAAREQLKHLVHKPVTTSRPSSPILGQEANPVAEALDGALDCLEVVAWRRLPSGAAVRYTCLQHAGTGRFIVAAASLFSGDAESLPRWIASDTHRQVACVLRSGGLHWHAIVGQAMDAWDAEL
ncbi:hypothetical protein [Pseudomonas viridiflava]|uniref:hypothetical protein n=1 Tax=Pseudomonas viridiflava TaxID=33069 RepID=UPI001C31C50E|nr:hypothetical protein [Pseudomonas viridiflava]QXG47490.1 hypothetical protein KTT57_28760 [Pseudomonas viridiflava]